MFITLKQYHIFHNNVLGMKWPKRCKKSPFHCLGYHPKILVSVGWILPNQLSPEPENLDSNIIQSVDELNVLRVAGQEIRLLPKGRCKKKNGKCGNFSQVGDPPPLFGNDMFFWKKIWFILHFRTFFGGVSHVKNSEKWKWDLGRPPPLFFSKFPHFPVFFFGQRP